MVKKMMWVEYDDESHLSKSRNDPGKYSPLTREDGTNKLGHVTLSDVDEDDFGREYQDGDDDLPAKGEEPASHWALETLGAVISVAASNPQVVRWLAEQAMPAVSSAWKRLRLRASAQSVDRGEQAQRAHATPAIERQEVLAALDACQAGLGTAQARNRFLTALLPRLYNEEQLRMLREARIDDAKALLEHDMTQTLTVERFRSAIRALLQENPDVVTGRGRAELARIVDRGH
jgi:hypothetical protein